MIVEARDHVRSTLRVELRCAASTRRNSFSSMNGPFLVDLEILTQLLYFSYRRRTIRPSLCFLPLVR
jgi:hypothetical protein